MPWRIYANICRINMIFKTITAANGSMIFLAMWHLHSMTHWSIACGKIRIVRVRKCLFPFWQKRGFVSHSMPSIHVKFTPTSKKSDSSEGSVKDHWCCKTFIFQINISSIKNVLKFFSFSMATGMMTVNQNQNITHWHIESGYESGKKMAYPIRVVSLMRLTILSYYFYWMSLNWFVSLMLNIVLDWLYPFNCLRKVIYWDWTGQWW